METQLFGEFKAIQQIGKGSFGSVFEVLRLSDAQTFALKTVSLTGISQSTRQKTLQEVRLLASIEHRNVVGFETSFFDPQSDSICVVMEYAARGDLKHKIEEYKNDRRKIPEGAIWKVLLHVARGLSYLHANRVVHRDIKSANIFETVDGIYKIGDLNLCKVFQDGSFAKTQLGTPNYASPEIWKNQEYGSQSDIWSLGVLIYELAALKCPFQAKTAKELYKKITQPEDTPKIPSTYSSLLSSTIKEMLCQNPSCRPDADDLIRTCLSVISPLYESISVQNIQGEFSLMQNIILPNTRSRWNSLLPKSSYRSKTQRTVSIDRLRLHFDKSMVEDESTREIDNQSLLIRKRGEPVLPKPSGRRPVKGVVGAALPRPRRWNNLR